MADLLADRNGNFEEGDDGHWVFPGFNDWEDTGEIQSTVKMEGTYALNLTHYAGGGFGAPPPTKEDAQNGSVDGPDGWISVIADNEHTVSFWVYADQQISGYWLEVMHYKYGDPGQDYALIQIARIYATDLSPGWNYKEYTATPETSEDAIYFRTGNVVPYGAAVDPTQWYIDNVRYVDPTIPDEEEVAFTLTLRNGLEADLTNYTGWSVTPQTISAKVPSDFDQVRVPAVYIAPGGGGEADLETVDNIRSGAIQQFALVAVVNTTTSVDDMDNLTDDIRNAVERSDSSLLGLSTVHNVNVISWDDVIPDEDDPQPTRLLRQIVVAIEYIYNRGSV